MKKYQVWVKEYRGTDYAIACLNISPENSMMEDDSIIDALAEASAIYDIIVDDEYNDVSDYEIIEIKQLAD